MKNIGRIARYSAPYFILINLAVLIGWLIFHSDVRFGLTLSVVCPILCGILSVLAEKNSHKGSGFM